MNWRLNFLFLVAKSDWPSFLISNPGDERQASCTVAAPVVLSCSIGQQHSIGEIAQTYTNPKHKTANREAVRIRNF